MLLHGFTMTRRCWGGLDADLAVDHEVISVDLPGHGEAQPVGAPVAEAADALAELGPAVFCGYSLGGRHALVLAARHPDALDGLVTIGATAGIDDPDARAARHDTDVARARRLVLGGVDAFLDEWLGMPLFADLPAADAHLDERRTNRASGLASSLVLAGTGAQVPVWDELTHATMPARFVVGGDDERFVAVTDRLVGAWGGDGRRVTVDGVGHAAHLLAPSAVAEAVRAVTGRSPTAAP